MRRCSHTKGLPPLISRENVLLALFSYNRGPELEIVLDSIYQMAPGFQLVAFDDRSNRIETLEILRQSRQIAEVFQTDLSIHWQEKCGNLYFNLSQAARFASNRGFRYLWALADDEQFVAEVSTELMQSWSHIFHADCRVQAVDPRFVGHRSMVVPSPIGKGYVWRKSPHFSTFSIYDLDRMSELSFTFGRNIQEARKDASHAGALSIIPPDAVIAKLPFPKMYRKSGPRLEIRHGAQFLGSEQPKWKPLKSRLHFTGPPLVRWLAVDGSLSARVLLRLYPEQLRFSGSGHTLSSKILAYPSETFDRCRFAFVRLLKHAFGGILCRYFHNLRGSRN